MVVEEVEVSEIPKKEEEKNVEAEPRILDEAAKVSSSAIAEAMTDKQKFNIVKETKPTPSKKSPFAVLWIIIPGIFLLGAILGGIVFYQKGVNNGQEETPSPTAISTMSPTPSASPSASIDLTKYTISIFNGSGISGEAGRAKTLLTTAGFKVGSTANAATYDYTKTIIKAKSTVDAAFISELSNTLAKNYIIDTPLTLAASSGANVQVVVGSSKAIPQQ